MSKTAEKLRLMADLYGVSRVHLALVDAYAAMEARHMYEERRYPPPFGHDCQWCGRCVDRLHEAERRALAAIERLVGEDDD